MDFRQIIPDDLAAAPMDGFRLRARAMLTYNMKSITVATEMPHTLPPELRRVKATQCRENSYLVQGTAKACFFNLAPGCSPSAVAYAAPVYEIDYDIHTAHGNRKSGSGLLFYSQLTQTHC